MNGIRKKQLGIIELEKRQMLDAALGALATTVVFGEETVNAAPQVLDSDVSVTGSTFDFTGLDLTISTDGGASDQLGIVNEGTGAGQIGISGTNITYSGIVIGTLTSNGQNGANLTVELNGNASRIAIENLVEAITYSNVSNAPVLSRTVTFSLEGLFSEAMTVSIAPYNDAPSITANTGMTINEGATRVLSNTMLGIADPDTAAGSVTINLTTTLTNGRLELSTNAGVAINSFTLSALNSGLVRYVHNGSETLSDSFGFTVSDGQHTLAASTFNITVAPVDDAPVLNTNNGADVFQGFTTDIGGSEVPTQFGTEVLRKTGAGTFSSFHGTINGNLNTQISLIFTTPANLINSNPGQILFETGSSATGLGLYLNNQNQLALFAGAATAIPRLTSALTLETSTQYAVVIEIDAASDQIRMHYAQAGNFNWFAFGRAAEEQINNWTTTTIAANNGAGYGVLSSTRGGFNGTVVGVSTFAGTLDSPLILTRFPTSTTTFVNTNLVFADVDTAAANIVYTITDNVDYGTLYRNGVALGLGSTFTQTDLNNALIKYTHNNAVTPDDSFTFSVSDGTNVVAGNIYSINVNTANNAPDIPDQSLSVSEDASNGSTVGTIIATDPDSAGGQILSYSIQGGTGSGIFAINATTGVVTVTNNSTLDYETATSYTLLVRATDNGPGSLFYERLITVNVQDVNENTAPVIAVGGPFNINENVGNNTNVGTVSAIDAQGDGITYSIVSGNTNTAFKINAAGLIQVNGANKIDFEAVSTYTLRIRATDNNALPLFSERNFVININNLNEAPSLQIDEVINTLDLNVKYNPSNGNFYKMIATTATFTAAMNNASNALLNGANGHLLTITSAAENTFVDNNVLTTHVWLAASDLETEGVWKWMTGPEAGSIFSLGPNATAGFYENWNGAEPNNGVAYNYAYMNTNGAWYDQDLTTNRAYVIEWESYDVINNRNYVLDYSGPNGSDIANGTVIGRVQAGDQDAGDTLTYSITAGNSSGIFEIDAATGQLRILDNTNIDTALQNLYNLTIRVQDTAGLSDTTTINIRFNQLTTIGTNATLSATEGISTVITTATLNIVDSDTAPANLVVTITNQPDRGFIALSTAPGVALTSFTQADLNANRVIYVHNGTENFIDSFEFSVSDGSSTISGQTFNITITPVNDSPVINVNTGTTVLEGGSQIITSAMLSAQDADDTPAGLTYTVNSLTRGAIEVNGTIQNTFTQAQINAGLVRFIHNGTEGNGGFNVTVADGGEDGATTSTVNFTLTVIPVNDAPTIVNNTGTTVTEGGNRIITTAMLSATDPDDIVTTLIYTLSGIQNGTVELTTNPGVPVVTFTQNDINTNRVRFVHDGNEADARFNFSIADGGEDGAAPATGTFILTKIDVNDAPTIAINLGASVNQNSIVILKNSVLAAYDPDDTSSGLTYTITGTVNGQLERISNPNVAITSFTQEDINNSQIVFRHSGPIGAASFNFTLADGGENGAGTASGVFNLTVDNTNDSPVIATNVPQTINNGTTLALTTAMLDSFDPDDLGDGLTWSIRNLQSGVLRVNGIIQDTFTQTQLDNGLVTFTHDGSRTTTAGFTATIADGGEDGATTATAFFKLNINPHNTAPQVDVNDPVTLAEGGSATVTPADLAISDPDNISWYNTNWQYRQQITIDHTRVGSDLTNYVLLIDGSNFTADFWSNVKNDGSDIVITLSDGTKLARELVSINRVAGTMELHVRIPALSSSTDTQLYIYYGNLAASETNNNALTYSQYSHVYHMNQLNTVDVVGGRNGTNSGGGAIVTSVIGNGVDFSGMGNIDIPTINGAGIRTVSFWYNPDTQGGGGFGSILGSTTYDSGIRHTGTNELNVRISANNIISSSPTFDTNKHLMFAYNSATGTINLYENGVLQDTDTFSGWYNFEYLVGIASANDRAIDGTIDEVRLSSNTLSAGWAATEYANQSNPSSFFRLSGQQVYQNQSLSYSISSLTAHGTLYLDLNGNNTLDGGEALSISSTFTQADLAANRIKYIHDGSEGSTDSFTFRAYDGTDYSAPQTFNFIITPVNDAPVLSANTGLTLNEGANTLITAAHLSYSDADNIASDLLYTASNIANGHIEVSGVTATSFTQDDINNNRVRFIHDGSETLAAGFDFTLNDGSATISGQSFDITITPVNDAPTITTNVAQSFAEGSSTILSTAMLNVTDPDDGAANLSWSVSNLSNGIITVNGVTQNSFTQSQLASGLVRFIHDGSETLAAGFDLTVTDAGGLSDNASFAIAITPVNDAPTITTNVAQSFAEGSSTILSTAMLNVTDPDDSAADLTWSATNLSNGIITVGGVTQNSFTQSQLASGLVRFIHDGSETLAAGFDFTVTDAGGLSDNASFAITITPVNDAPVLSANTGLSMNEGANTLITAAHLSYSDADNIASDLLYTASNIANGHIEVSGLAATSFTQDDINNNRVRFIHDGSETLSAGFDFTLSDGSATISGQSFDITITPVNDAPVLSANTGLTLNEGANTLITSSHLSYSDADNIASNLLYTASNIANGHIEVSGLAATSFTQDDINNNRVRFIHDGSETLSAGFDFTLSDGSATISGQSFDITITPINDAPVLSANTGLTLNEGANTLITAAHLSYSDADNIASDLLYTASNIANGHIEVSGLAATSFTQDDIDNNRVRFIHDGSETLSAGFDFTLSDGSATISGQSFDISITPVNDAPTAISLSGNSITETASIGSVIGTLGATDVDLPGDAFTFTIINDPDNKFIIVGNQLRLNGALDYTLAAQHSIEIEVSDNNGGTFNQIFIIDVIENAAPTDILIDHDSIAENSAIGTTIGALSAVDSDAGESFTYTLIDNPGGFFEINGGALRVIAPIDFETTPFVNLTIRVTDSANNSFDKVITIHITDEAEGSSGDHIVSQSPPKDPQTGLSAGESYSSLYFHGVNKRDMFRVSEILEPETLYDPQSYILAAIRSGNGMLDAFYGDGHQILRNNTLTFLQDNLSPVFDLSPASTMPSHLYSTHGTDANIPADQPENQPDNMPPEIQDNADRLRAILMELQHQDHAANENGNPPIYANTLQSGFMDVITYQEQKRAALREALLSI